MTKPDRLVQSPHQGQPVHKIGEPLERAHTAMIMLHGRGASAEDILTLAGQLATPGFAYFAPQAAGNTWYPNRFLDPIETNEPWLSSALSLVGNVLAQITVGGIPSERVMLLGFSQGACLALEFAARNAQRYGGLVGLSGALIGPELASYDDSGSLAGTPVFLGCSDIDFHVPKERVNETAEILKRLEGNVTKRLYPNLGHTVNEDEIEFVRGMMRTMIAA